MNAHSDIITSLDSLSGTNQIYSGSKDGFVKVWTQQEGALADLRCLAKLEGNSTLSSVNSVCAIENTLDQVFATANHDKSIRIWSKSNLNGQRSPEKMSID